MASHFAAHERRDGMFAAEMYFWRELLTPAAWNHLIVRGSTSGGSRLRAPLDDE
jgi:hypothetical protein